MSAQPENAQRSASALRKRKEREKNEARKSELKALIKWHMDRLPAEAKAEKTEVTRASWRKSIDPVGLLEDCVKVIKMSPRLSGGTLPPPQDQGARASYRGCLGGGESAGAMPTSPQMYRRGLGISRTFGVLLVDTTTMDILEGNMAFEKWWILPGMMQDQRNLAGLSLWALVDWNDHNEVEMMREMFTMKNQSIVGEKFRLGLIRITKCSTVGSLAKTVDRMVEVLHLSADGSTALLGLHLKEKDGKSLVLHDAWSPLKDETLAFRIDFRKPQAPSDEPNDPMANTTTRNIEEGGFPGTSLLKFEEMVKTMTKYAPPIFVINGPDDDGVLRHMAFTKLELSTTLCQSSVPFIPLVNVRLGDIRQSKMMTVENCAAKEIGWESWMLCSEKEENHNVHVQESQETLGHNAFRFLQAVFSRTWSSPDKPPFDVVVGYAMASPKEITVIRMRTSGMRPAKVSSPKILVSTQWPDMVQDIKAVKNVFSFWEGQPQFMDLATST